MSARWTFDGWYRAAMPAKRLATLRITIGAFAWIYVIARLPYFGDYSRFVAAQFRPIGLVSLLDSPLPNAATWGIAIATAVTGAAFVAGFRYRLSGPLFALGLLWVTTYRSSWGMIFHTENLMVLHVLLLGIAPAAAAWSLDARLRTEDANDGGDEDPRFGWPIRLMCMVTVLTYLIAGVTKLRNTGIAWVTTDFLSNYVAYDALRKIELGSLHSPIGAWMAARPWLFKPLAAFSLAVELLAPLALCGRRPARIWAACVVLFHAGVLALMAILFAYPLFGFALLPFFAVEEPAERLVTWLSRRWAARRETA